MSMLPTSHAMTVRFSDVLEDPMHRPLSLVAIVGCLAAACSSGVSLGPLSPTAGPQCGSVIRGGTFSAVVDGVVWSTTSPTGGFSCGFTNGLTIRLLPPSDDGVIAFEVQVGTVRNLTPGIYPAGGVVPPWGGAYISRYDARSWFAGPGATGSVKVSAASSEGVAGTFSFTLTAVSGRDDPPIIITNGSFDVLF